MEGKVENWAFKAAFSWALARWQTLAGWAIGRLQEPSTWASIAVWVTAQAHIAASPTLQNAFVQFGVNLAAFLGVVLKEKAHVSNGGNT